MAKSMEEQILEKLDVIIKLLALQASSGTTTVTEAARSLKLAGLDNQTIAEVLNANVTVVRSLTTNLRVKPPKKSIGR